MSETPLERSVKMLLDYATPRKCDDEGSMGCIRCNVIRVCSAVLTLSADCAAMRETLQGIANANYREWVEGFDTAQAFFDWAKSRAKHALSTTAGTELLAERDALKAKVEEQKAELEELLGIRDKFHNAEMGEAAFKEQRDTALALADRLAGALERLHIYEARRSSPDTAYDDPMMIQARAALSAYRETKKI